MSEIRRERESQRDRDDERNREIGRESQRRSFVVGV